MSCIACLNISQQPVDASGCSQSACACCGRDFTVLKGPQIDHTVIASLTPCVDQIRDIYTQFGARPYTVSLIWTRWSGGQRGIGVEEVAELEQILPTPKIGPLTAIDTNVSPVGTEELGNIRLSEISPRYTEDRLNGISSDGTQTPEDQNFYYEVVYLRADGPGVRRRFTPSGTPSYDPLKFQWVVNLSKQYDDRARNQDPDG